MVGIDCKSVQGHVGSDCKRYESCFCNSRRSALESCVVMMLGCSPCFFAHNTPFAGQQRMCSEREGADCAANEPKRRQSCGGGHSTHLSVLALGECDRDPRAGDVLTHPHRGISRPQPSWCFNPYGVTTARREVPQIHRLSKLFQVSCLGQTFYQDEIGFEFSMIGVTDLVLQLAIVRQQHQSLAVGIQPSRRVNARRVNVAS